MIYSLKGVLVYLEQVDNIYHAAIECDSGVAFELKITATTATMCPKVGESLKLYTHFVSRENAIDIFGFYDLDERKSFKMLISVSGVGPSFALSILSCISTGQLITCIASGDSKTLTQCKGIGSKTAKRIILELKDKIGNISDKVVINQPIALGNETISNFDEAISALVVLGYSKGDATKAVMGQSKDRSVEQLIKEALKILAAN